MQCFQQNWDTAPGFSLVLANSLFLSLYFSIFPSNGSRPYSHFRSAGPGQRSRAFTTDLRERPREQQLLWQDAESITLSLQPSATVVTLRSEAQTALCE